MKKLLLSVLFILSISPLLAMVGTNVPIKADDIVIGGNSYVEDVITQSEYNKLNYSGLLAEFLKQGGTIDTTNINPDYGVDDVVEEIGETIYEVLRDTGNFVDWIGDSIFQSEGTAYPENIKPRMNDKLSNNMWYFLGLAPLLNSMEGGTDIVPTPPADYSAYIDKINGSGFDFLRNINNFHFTSPSFLTPYTWYNNLPWSNYSFFMGARYYSESNWNLSNIYISAPIFATPIQDINIISSNDQYTVTIINQYSNLPICYKGGYDSNTYLPEYGNYLYSFYDGTYGQTLLGNGYVNSDTQWSSQTYTGTLENVFSWLTTKCRNVNIYVDGVPWSIVGSNTNYSITLNPTTITPVDEHGRVRWKYDEEIYIDVDLMWQILDDFLNDPEQRLIRFSDIEDCIVDEDGQTAIAVKVVNDEDNVDEYYIKNYGTLIPLFPTDVSFPVSIDKMVSIVTVPVSVIPDDLMDVLKTLFIGTLMVCLLQRLLE